jgi:hypothetical protein
MNGYMHPRYAESLAEFGTPRELPRCGGWILERQVPGFPYRDAMGCYPLFACRDWSELHADLDDLAGDLVCISMVPELFARPDPAYLQQCFPDVMVPFKEHCVIDLEKPAETLVSQWMALHRTLVERHHITGIKAFSRASFALQLTTPGVVLLRARQGDAAVGAQIWFVQGDVAYGHVLAFSDVGYKLGAAYALYWVAMHHFASRARWASLGGMPGAGAQEAEGLYWFKRGWSEETRTAYFCGRIFDRDRYTEMTSARGVPATRYFPAYRLGEMD